ncbi:MAG: GNAT family N-acetyltransferase [Candidatus Omnitrophica bacterium]|nr:GNAT family N-acetyltransferase [Candidatus Omnitrophota bacterium]
MYTVKKINTINDVSRDQWDAMAHNNIFMCYAWMKTCEETLYKCNGCRYVLVYKVDTLCGATAWYIDKPVNELDLDDILLGRLKRIVRPFGVSFLPAIFCGPGMGYGTHFLFKVDLPETEQIQVAEFMLSALEEIQREMKRGICFNNVMKKEKILIGLLEKRGYAKTITLPTAYLDIEWNTFDQYKKCIRDRDSSMKRNLNREINRIARVGIEISECADIAVCNERLMELLALNFAKYNRFELPFNKNYILKMKDNFGDDCVAYIAKKKGEIVAVSLAVYHGSEGLTPYLGVDYSLSKGDFTYFNIGYYEPITGAITRKAKRFYYGNGMYPVKMRRGCKVEDAYIFFKPYDAIQNKVIRSWFAFHFRWMSHKYRRINRV